MKKSTDFENPENNYEKKVEVDRLEYPEYEHAILVGMYNEIPEKILHMSIYDILVLYMKFYSETTDNMILSKKEFIKLENIEKILEKLFSLDCLSKLNKVPETFFDSTESIKKDEMNIRKSPNILDLNAHISTTPITPPATKPISINKSKSYEKPTKSKNSKIIKETQTGSFIFDDE